MAYHVLGAAARLDIADHLREGPLTASELSDLIGGDDPEIVDKFLRVAETIGLVRRTSSGQLAETELLALLRRDGGRYRSTVLALTAPGFNRPSEMMHRAVLSGRAHTAQVLGTDLWGYYGTNPEEAKWFGGAMTDLTNLVADLVLARYEFSGRGTIMDVGGSHGIFLSRILHAQPDAKGVLFDRMEVVEEARNHLDQDIRTRIQIVGGNFFEGVPEGGDLYILKSVLCDWDDQSCLQILSRIRNAAMPGASLLIVDWLYPDESDPGLDAIYLQQAISVNGRVRNQEQFESLLKATGFAVTRVERTTPENWIPATIIEAIRR